MKMKRKATLIGGALLVGASMAAMPSASAQVPVCAGTDNTIVLCVDPTGGTPIGDCVYVGPPPCMPVSIPTPSITCGGRLGPACNFTIQLPPIS